MSRRIILNRRITSRYDVIVTSWECLIITCQEENWNSKSSNDNTLSCYYNEKVSWSPKNTHKRKMMKILVVTLKSRNNLPYLSFSFNWDDRHQSRLGILSCKFYIFPFFPLSKFHGYLIEFLCTSGPRCTLSSVST